MSGAVDSDAGSLDEFRHGAADGVADESVEFDDLLVELEPAATEAGERCVHATGWGELAAQGGELEQAFDARVVARAWSVPTSRALIRFLAVVVALMALLRTIVNARSASTAPSRSFGTAVACPDRTARAAASASIGSLLPLRRRLARSGRLTSKTVMPAAWRARVS